MILTALLLAIASSTDNFAVGLGMGLAQKPLSVRVNGIISILNALGAIIASFFGNAGQSTSWLSLLASLAFFYLAYDEFASRNTCYDEKDNSAKNPVPIASTGMAIPMTLNNLVGGAAGGVVGVPPSMAAICALLASYSAMAMGHWIGTQTASTATSYPSSQLAAAIYAILGVLSFWDAVVTR